MAILKNSIFAYEMRWNEINLTLEVNFPSHLQKIESNFPQKATSNEAGNSPLAFSIEFSCVEFSCLFIRDFLAFFHYRQKQESG